MFKLTKSKYRTLSSVNVNFSAVFLGSIVIPVFSGNFDNTKLAVIVLGLTLTIISILIAMYFAEKGKV